MTAKTKRGSKEKGSRAERGVAKALRDAGADPQAGRMPLSGADSHLKADVRTDLPVHIECKAAERVKFWQWWDQARANAIHETPILTITGSRRPHLAVLALEDLCDLLAAREQLEAIRDEGEARESESRGSQRRTESQRRWKRKVDGTVVRREDD